ncbi:TPA: methyltransferase domain-containing protein [Vibrio parahaemolyticus]|nr:class I SAM-dependent methyltransferase [Vibrio parahaemolyticus]HAS6609319.1 methyltransferase domain-containing protein [Vibrio parahaemolyticus]
MFQEETMAVHTLFSDKSDLYEVARPLYPEALFEYLATVVPSNELAWDCACGNGQAADSLVRYFERVKATDVSKEQISNAKHNSRIDYSVSSSESTDFADKSFDLVCVAQALHWFDFNKYWLEVKRVLKPNGVFAAWGYTWPSVDPAVDRVFKESILKVIEPYWAPQNRLLWEHYENIDIPFSRLPAPKIEMQASLTLDEFISFICTFSATRRCIDDIGDSFIKHAHLEFSKVWGQEADKRIVDLEFVLFVGKSET